MTTRFKYGDRCGGHLIIGCRHVTEMLEIYEAQDHRDGGPRILKVVVGGLLKEKAEAQLAKDARALATIESTHVAKFFDAGIDAGKLWLLCEDTKGPTLREKIGASGVPVMSLLRWIKQASDGVAAAHTKKILHRDLRPENIIIMDGIAKVIDFGVAKFVGVGPATALGLAIGTGAYTAPEHIKGKPDDGRMDVYSMSLILYEGLCGKNPMGGPGVSLPEACLRQMHHEPPPLISFVPNMREDLSFLVEWGLQKDPERRIRTMRDLSAELDKILERMLAPQRRSVWNLFPIDDPRTARTGEMAAVSKKPAPVPAPPSQPPATPTASTPSPPTSAPISTPAQPATLRSPSSPGPAPALGRPSSSGHSSSIEPATVSAPDLGRPRSLRARMNKRVVLPLAGVVVCAGLVLGWHRWARPPEPAAASTSDASAAAAPPMPSALATSQPVEATSTPATASPPTSPATASPPATAAPAAPGPPKVKRANPAPGATDPYRPPAPARTAEHRVFGLDR